jgi:hypothetical protein
LRYLTDRHYTAAGSPGSEPPTQRIIISASGLRPTGVGSSFFSHRLLEIARYLFGSIFALGVAVAVTGLADRKIRLTLGSLLPTIIYSYVSRQLLSHQSFGSIASMFVFVVERFLCDLVNSWRNCRTLYTEHIRILSERAHVNRDPLRSPSS